jgi:hypothetical protein
VSRIRCWWYHRRSHGKPWHGETCPVCRQQYTTPMPTPRYLWRRWRWNRAHPGYFDNWPADDE